MRRPVTFLGLGRREIAAANRQQKNRYRWRQASEGGESVGDEMYSAATIKYAPTSRWPLSSCSVVNGCVLSQDIGKCLLTALTGRMWVA